MARKRRRYGESTEQHREASRLDVREIKRLRDHFNSRMKAPADCSTALLLLRSLIATEGEYRINRRGSGGRLLSAGRGPMRLVNGAVRRFQLACVVKPSAAKLRKIHAVWR